VRVLMLNYEFPPIGGGGAPSTFNLARNVVRLGHEVDVITMGFQGIPSRETVDGVGVYRVPCFRRRQMVCDTREMATYVLSGLARAVALSRSRSYDLANAHFIFPTGPVGYALKRLAGLPHVLTARGSDVPGHNPNRFRLDHRLLAPAWRQIVRDADAVAAVSNDLKGKIQRHVPDVRVTVIPNGVSPLGESAAPTSSGLVSAEERARRILVVTRLHEFKGVQYLLRAVSDHRLDYEVHVVGEGPYRDALERQAAALDGKVRFWGWLDRTEAGLRDLYRRCGIFVFPSEQEGAPAALLEAMSEGLAVVAANSAGTPEVVGDAGLLVRPRDPADIARALGELAGPAVIGEYGRRARERVAGRFDWGVVAEQYVALYRDVLTRGSSRTARHEEGAGRGSRGS
jgi:glycosyltransferase involved in cell wall biosynthesis